MISAIAIDDEPLALQIIEEHAAQVQFLNLKGCFTNAVDAIQYLSANAVDVIFADIQMPDITGLQIAGQYSKEIQVVFTTAYPDYAIQGFELDVTDYLLKPISLLRFLQACQKVQQRKQPQTKHEDLFFKDGAEFVKVKPDEIQYAEAQGNYIKLVTTAEEHLLRMTFAELEEKLPAQLIRIHKSYAVNPSRIDRIETHQVTIGTAKIPVGNNYRKDMVTGLGLNKD